MFDKAVQEFMEAADIEAAEIQKTYRRLRNEVRCSCAEDCTDEEVGAAFRQQAVALQERYWRFHAFVSQVTLTVHHLTGCLLEAPEVIETAKNTADVLERKLGS